MFGGFGAACAVDAEGAVACWGSPESAILDTPDQTGFQAVTIGTYHACALDTEREAVCWGEDGVGQVSTTPAGRWVSIDAGRALTCGERDDGEIVCWGCYGDGDGYCDWGTPVDALPVTSR